MNKKSNRKLTLDKTTVRALVRTELMEANGGLHRPETNDSNCGHTCSVLGMVC